MGSKVETDALVRKLGPPYFFVKYLLLCGQTRVSVPTCSTTSHRTNNSFTCLLIYSFTIYSYTRQLELIIILNYEL